jgi:hypothetical protein
MAIVNLHKELDKGKLEALVEIYEKINKLEFEEMLEFIIHQTIETLGVKRCAIFKVFPEPEVVALVAGEWQNDPSCSDFVENLFGTSNCLKIVE